MSPRLAILTVAANLLIVAAYALIAHALTLAWRALRTWQHTTTQQRRHAQWIRNRILS